MKKGIQEYWLMIHRNKQINMEFKKKAVLKVCENMKILILESMMVSIIIIILNTNNFTDLSDKDKLKIERERNEAYKNTMNKLRYNYFKEIINLREYTDQLE
jgi:hypothetical protein